MHQTQGIKVLYAFTGIVLAVDLLLCFFCFFLQNSCC